MQGLRLQGTCMCIKSERKPKKPKYSWVTKELAGTCMCMESDFVGRGKQRAWLDEYKHRCCDEAQ